MADVDTLEPLIDANERFFDTVATAHKAESAALQAASAVPLLVQLVRDWAKEGERLRRLCYDPVVAALRRWVGVVADARLLIPGSGLGRLAFEAAGALQGAEILALEQSYHSVLVAAVMMEHDGVGYHMDGVVSMECDEDAEQCWEAPYPGEGAGRHVIYPSIHLGANWASNSDKLASVAVPDVDILKVKEVAGHANIQLLVGSFPDVFTESEPERQEAERGFDAVLSVFFVDVVRDPVEAVHAMRDLLERRGGVWINLGPMAYPGGAAVELSYAQLRALLVASGFQMLAESELPCEYNYLPGHKERISHRCFFFVARPVRRRQRVGLGRVAPAARQDPPEAGRLREDELYEDDEEDEAEEAGVKEEEEEADDDVDDDDYVEDREDDEEGEDEDEDEEEEGEDEDEEYEDGEGHEEAGFRGGGRLHETRQDRGAPVELSVDLTF